MTDRRRMRCPYCDFAIQRELTKDRRLRCPQCSGPLKIAVNYLTEIAWVLGIAVTVIWFWIGMGRFDSLWDLYLLVMLATLIGPLWLVSLILPKRLAPLEESEEFNGLNLGSSQPNETSDHAPDEHPTHTDLGG